MAVIRTAADALAALDAHNALELRYDGPIPADERARAKALYDAGAAWCAAHPAEVAAEREARRAALRAHEDGADEAWARSLPRRPDDAILRRVGR